jgi:chemotaxis protein CheD
MAALEKAVNAMEEPQLRKVYLYPGQIFISAEPALVTTILGSCVAVCLWDPVARIGGINHYLLPTNPLRGQSDPRYGNTAIEKLIDTICHRGAELTRIQAKVVGGASIMARSSEGRLSIGDQNVAIARKSLGAHSIAISAEQVGGVRGRKLLFHTGNGCASIKEI